MFWASQNYGIPLAPTLMEADPDLLRAIALCRAVRWAAKKHHLQRSGADWELLQWIADDD